MTATTAVLGSVALVLASLGVRVVAWERREARKTPEQRRADALDAANRKD